MVRRSNADHKFYGAVAEAFSFAVAAAETVAAELVRQRVSRAGISSTFASFSTGIATLDFEALPEAAYPASISLGGEASVEDARAVVRLYRLSEELMRARFVDPTTKEVRV